MEPSNISLKTPNFYLALMKLLSDLFVFIRFWEYLSFDRYYQRLQSCNDILLFYQAQSRHFHYSNYAYNEARDAPTLKLPQ
jgi:hypothetical protein